MSGFHRLTVAEVRKETRDAVTVKFVLDPALREAFKFQPGQYLTLRVHLEGEELRRNYSICSTPDECTLRVAIKRIAQGRFSTWANTQLRAGDAVDVMSPSGGFVRRPSAAPANYLALAAGSGITPILSIIKATLKAEPAAQFTLIYGNRAAHAVMFREELEDLKNLYMTRFTLVHVLSREQQDVDILNGHIDGAKCSALFAHWVDVEDLTAAYLCGPQSMMDEATAALMGAGVAQHRIHREVFVLDRAPRIARVSSGPEATLGECQVSVIQDGRTQEFSMQRGTQSVLGAALAQGIELPWSCRAGVCSTCRCKVVEGEVEMDTNFALEDYEVARGFRLACQSYPLTAQLTVDYDQHN